MTFDGLSPIQFGGSLTQQQFFAVQSGLLPKWMRYWPIAIAVVFLTVFNISVGVGWQKFVQNPFSATGDLASMIVLVVLVPFFIRRAWARAYRQAQQLHGDVSGVIDSAGVTWKTKMSTSTLAWGNVVRAKLLPDLVLLFYSERCAFYFPRSFFRSDEEWGRFRDAVGAILRA